MTTPSDATSKPEMDTQLRVDIYKFFGATQFLGRNVLVSKDRMIATLQDAENERRIAAKSENENKRVLEELRQKIRELEQLTMLEKSAAMSNADDDKDGTAGAQAKASTQPSTPAPPVPTNTPTMVGASSAEGKKKKKRDTE